MKNLYIHDNVSLISSYNDQAVEEIKTQILCSFLHQNRAVYGVMWEIMVQRDTPQMAM